MDENRVAILGIIISDTDCAESVNGLLHDYNQYIVGRMGIPYHTKNINIICVVMDAPQPAISNLSGRIGRLNGVNCKVTYSQK